MTTRGEGLGAEAPVDVLKVAARLGVGAEVLDPAVAAAVSRLFAQIDDLRTKLGEVQDLADHDALTPLLNRRAFVRELGRALAYAHRYGTPASLVYFDVDGLKALNDRQGHAAGDLVVKAVAERLLAHVRASDLVGRMGGDEFAILLAQTNGFQAEVKAARLAATVAEPLTLGEEAISVVVSWGVAQVRPGMEAEDALAEADAAMYAGKRT